MRIPLLCAMIAVMVGVARPDTADAQTDPFVAVRAYPAGIVGAAGIAGDFGRFETGGWAGYNFTRRGDWGEHDDERGGGFGGGIEAAFFPGGRAGVPGGRASGWFFGARASLWRLDIEWRDDPPLGPVRVGETRIVVVQPTARAGYRFGLGGRLSLDTEAAFGVEMNVHTDGENVGEGAILLAGLRLIL